MSRTLDIACCYKTMQLWSTGRRAGTLTACLWKSKLRKNWGSRKPDIEAYDREVQLECRRSVLTYEKLWREFTERTAYW